jgi:diphthamide biosynthesis protein 2
MASAVSDASGVGMSRRVGDLERYFEIDETCAFIRRVGALRIALQLPDELLSSAPAIVAALTLQLAQADAADAAVTAAAAAAAPPGGASGVVSDSAAVANATIVNSPQSGAGSAGDPVASLGQPRQRRLFVLGDTSYGACCVDEVAAAVSE